MDGEKIKHEMLMGSQEKITTEKELDDWFRLKKIKYPVMVQEKLDGISVELIYENGELVLALTRGDGYFGTNILKNVLEMNVPKNIHDKSRISVRGEILLKRSSFETRPNITSSNTVSLRNIASGIAYQKHGTENCDLLTIVCYDTTFQSSLSKEENRLTDENEKLAFFMMNKFEVPITYCVDNQVSLLNALNEIKKLKDEQDYAIDGAVIKQCLPLKEDRLRPTYQRAFKWQAEEGTTKLLDVEWYRSGNLYTPVAILEPVELSGTTVSKASLANLGIIKELGLHIGDEVIVRKRGEIIPKIEVVCEECSSGKLVEETVPKVCEFCGTQLTITDTKVSCENFGCDSVLEHRINKWLDMTGALGFGDATRKYLFYDCGMKNICDYYCNENVKNAISNTNKKKALQKAFAELFAKSTNISLEDFMSGFDIPLWGSKIFKLVVDAGFNTIETIRKVKFEELLNINGIGDERAKTFCEYIPILEDEINSVLKTNRVRIRSNFDSKNNQTKNYNVCITGKLSVPRADFEDILTSNGCSLASSVSKNVNYLITNEPDSGSSKNKRARELNIPIMSEEEFLKFLGIGEK